MKFLIVTIRKKNRYGFGEVQNCFAFAALGNRQSRRGKILLFSEYPKFQSAGEPLVCDDDQPLFVVGRFLTPAVVLKLYQIICGG